MRKNLLWVSICLLLLAGCGLKKNQQLAAATIVEFHKNLNAGAVDTIYDAASADFKNAVTREQWRKVVHTVTTKLGTHISSAEPTVFVNWTTKGTFVKASCDSKFEKAAGTENFEFRKDGDKLVLFGYHVNSAALLE
jgi:hypothetical protein